MDILLPALLAALLRLLCFVLLRPAAPVTTSISLTLKAGENLARAQALPGQAPPAARATVSLKSGEKPLVRWEARNRDPKKSVASIVVHFLITRENHAGAPIPDGPQKGGYQDSVLGTDLAPRETTTGEYNTAVYEPGTYLVEVEILDETGTRQQYCAAEMVVQ